MLSSETSMGGTCGLEGAGRRKDLEDGTRPSPYDALLFGEEIDLCRDHLSSGGKDGKRQREGSRRYVLRPHWDTGPEKHFTRAEG